MGDDDAFVRRAVVVNPETGEQLDEVELDERTGAITNRAARDQMDGAGREIAGWRARYADATRDADRDARDDPLWEEARLVFDYWRERCRHPKARFSAERFQMIKPFLKKDGAALCRKAIEGAAFDPFITRRKNGSAKRHDGWGLIFRPGREKFEEFVNKAPIHPRADELYRVANEILARIPEDDRPTEERTMQAVGEAQEWFRQPRQQVELRERERRENGGPG